MIASASNDKVKRIKKLMQQARFRREEQVFLVEGIRVVREIPKTWLAALYVSESGREKYADMIADRDIPVEVVKDSVFSGMSDTNTPQGILAEVSMPSYTPEDLFSTEERPFILIIEHLQDPGNLGTIIRTAEGAGVSGILMSTDTVDVYNPKVIRSTMGSVFRVPFYVADNLETEILKLREQGVKIYGAHLDGGSFYEKDFREACAFLIGNEGNGLSERVSRLADDLIRIPMKGKVESLNAAVSTAVIAYEVLRQRT